MSCKCRNVKLYDGEHRCMECFAEFEPKRGYRYFIKHDREYFNFVEMLSGKRKLGTKRTDNLPLGGR